MVVKRHERGYVQVRITDKFVFFFTKRDYLSQWYPAQFEVKGLVFANAEQYMMACKAIIFDYSNPSAEEIKEIISTERKEAGLSDFVNGQFVKSPSGELKMGTLASIMETSDPKVAKANGKAVVNFVKSIWDVKSEPVIKSGTRAKMTQNPRLLRMFLDTKGRRLVEASPFDDLYGIGLREHHPHAEQPDKWLGENRLGNWMTDVRDELLLHYGE
ncbi:Riboflavin biosynthesis intermediates N-glycosidase [Vibrio chagasii]|nr:Riboflavin biosynthesis intermediates N-glycosidase [Vibrio chagasii]